MRKRPQLNPKAFPPLENPSRFPWKPSRTQNCARALRRPFPVILIALNRTLMKIGHAEVEYVAKLANLAITEEEKRRFIDQLNSILEYVEQLNSLNTDNVEPTAQVVYASEQDLGMRQDEPRVTFSQEESLSNGPATGAGYFKVPKVIEER